jgi:hypothetical protein
VLRRGNIAITGSIYQRVDQRRMSRGGWWMRRRGLWIVIVGMAVLGTACSGSSASPPPAGSPLKSSTPPATIPRSPSPQPTPSDSPPAAAHEDGRYFGSIKSVDLSGDSSSVVFDLAYFLTGDEGKKAAIEDGFIKKGEGLDNDYYIRNNNPLLRTLSLSAGASVEIVDWARCCESITGDLQAFADSFSPEMSGSGYRGPSSPYWITLQGGRIVLVEEQYLP